MEQLTAERALELLTCVVKREGRTTVRECHYVAERADGIPHPHCIAGCVFAEIGVSVRQLDELGSSTISGLYHDGLLDGVIDLSFDALHIIREAQSVQDNGNDRGRQMWGHALAAARRLAWARGVTGKHHEAHDEARRVVLRSARGRYR